MIIQSKRVWLNGVFVESQIEVEGSKITNIYNYGEKDVDFDYGDKRIVPGFIDQHCHGYYGFDVNDAEEEGLRNWTKNIPSEGVTAFLPTTITQMNDILTAAVKNIAKVVDEGYEGAEILGIHFEGPYLDMKYKGAQPPEAIVKPNVEEFKQYQKDAKGLIRLITIATEHDDDFALTKYCSQNNVAVSIGHSSCTYQQALMGVANGAKSMTHVYNGMSPFNHREPGLVGAALRLRDTFGEVIADGNHSDVSSLNTFFKAKGKNHGIMVSDALRVKGLPAGTRVLFGGHEIELQENGSARLLETGSLAGSTLRINEGLRILVEKAMVPFDAALNSCTINPATLLGVDDRKGRITSGYDADIVVLNDDYTVEQTFSRGQAYKEQ